MLSENIKTFRKKQGLSQEDLAVRLNVVRQTVSKWEKGLSVPDAEMLIRLADAFGTSVSTLLGESVQEDKSEDPSEDVRILAEKLETINLQLVQEKAVRRLVLHWLFIAACVGIVAAFAGLKVLDGCWQDLGLSDAESVVVGTILHGAAWVYARIALPAFVGAVIGACLTRKRA